MNNIYFPIQVKTFKMPLSELENKKTFLVFNEPGISTVYVCIGTLVPPEENISSTHNLIKINTYKLGLLSAIPIGTRNTLNDIEESIVAIPCDREKCIQLIQIHNPQNDCFELFPESSDEYKEWISAIDKIIENDRNSEIFTESMYFLNPQLEKK